jgi:hypothetical protein
VRFIYGLEKTKQAYSITATLMEKFLIKANFCKQVKKIVSIALRGYYFDVRRAAHGTIGKPDFIFTKSKILKNFYFRGLIFPFFEPL